MFVKRTLIGPPFLAKVFSQKEGTPLNPGKLVQKPPLGILKEGPFSV